jgi:hypothetical protein
MRKSREDTARARPLRPDTEPSYLRATVDPPQRQTAPMRSLIRSTMTHPALALGSTVLWGLVEFMALWRSRWLTRSHRRELTP